MGKLHIGTAYNVNDFDNSMGVALQPLLQFQGNGMHGRRGKGVVSMHSERIDILDETDRNNLILRVADDFKLQFFPAQQRFLYKDLSHHTGGDTACRNGT